METNLPPNQNPSEAEAQAPQASPGNKLFIVVILSMLLTASITGLVVYFWQKSTSEKAIGNLEQRISSLERQLSTTKSLKTTPQPISLPGLSPTPTTDPTANWKIYSKKSINFGSFYIKYPEDWTVVEKQTEEPEREQIITTLSKADHKIKINAFVDGWSPSGCNFDKTIKNKPQFADYDSYVNINNPSIELRRALPPLENKERMSNSFATAFPFSGTIVYFTPKNFDEVIVKEMDQTLSTFRFAD